MTMVEKVRQAVRDEAGSRLCAWPPSLDPAKRCHGDRPVCLCRDIARVAIEAMTEPTPEMLAAADEPFWQAHGNARAYAHRYNRPMAYCSEELIAPSYTAMIRAALADTEPSDG